MKQKSISRRQLLTSSTMFAASGLFGSFALHAQPVAPADVTAARAVVQAQLDAIAAGDAEGAFGYAAPGIRAKLGSAEAFLTMVRRGYPAVDQPASIAFLTPEWVDDVLVQQVRLTDRLGKLWIAFYQLERQPDRSWRITGCDLQPIGGRGA